MNGIKYRKPEEMKDSRIDWYEFIPKEWKTIKGKYVFYNKRVINSGKIKEVISLTLNGVIDRDIYSNDGLQPKDFKGYQEFKKDDLVFKLIDLENINTSRVGIVHKDGLMSPAYIRLTTNRRIVNRFYYYLYYSLYIKKIYNNIGNSGVRSSLNAGDLLDIEIFNLDNLEQQKIANFLDIKTAQFDSIISKKELLIQKLEEAKKSLISEVVTGKVKIIDGEMVPRLPEEMKDSGVEWLGMMPKDWRNAHIRYFAVITSGGTPNRNKIEYWENGDIPWLNSGEINKEIINYSTNFITKAGYMNSNAKYLPINTVLIALNGQGATKGKVALLKCKATCNQSLGAFVCNEKNLIPEYLFFQLKAKYSDIRGLVGENREGLSINLLKRTYILIPSIDEQKFIVEFLVYKTNQIDQILSKEMIQISKLKSAKQSLISEAVTGKIDLRDWVIIEEGEVQ